MGLLLFLASFDWKDPMSVEAAQQVETKAQKVERLKRETAAALNTFAGVIDERDPNTASHSKRVAEYVERFTAAIELPDREAARLIQAARYHDLGKVVVDESTLSRPGRLSQEELRKIRSHPALSARLLSPFHFAQEIAVYAELHHERYDGRGYYSVPQREIPVEAHVLIAADSFDAMTSARAYRPALSIAEAIQELRDKAGTQFHPLVAQAFAAMLEQRDVHAAMGSAQIASLRAEFSRIAGVQLPRPGAVLRPREHQRLRHFVALEQYEQKVRLQLLPDRINRLGDSYCGKRTTSEVDHRGIVQHLSRKSGDQRWHRRAEQQRLPLGRYQA